MDPGSCQDWGSGPWPSTGQPVKERSPGDSRGSYHGSVAKPWMISSLDAQSLKPLSENCPADLRGRSFGANPPATQTQSPHNQKHSPLTLTSRKHSLYKPIHKTHFANPLGQKPNQSFSKHRPGTCHLPGSILGTGDTSVAKPDKGPAPCKVSHSHRDTNCKK